MVERLARAAGAFVDVLVPAACPLCRGARGVCVCEAWPRTPPDVARCSRCAACVPPPLAGTPCAACRRRPPSFDAVIALGDYEGKSEVKSEGGAGDAVVGRSLREWILRYKHGGRRELARELGARLARRTRAVCAAEGRPLPQVVVPVPLHPLRRLERGYDQGLLLAREVAEGLGRPLGRWLVRVRTAPPQGSLGSGRRRGDLERAFAVGPEPWWRRLRRGTRPVLRRASVLLVDDVLTSGSTANDAARALRAAGAGRIDVAVLARAGPRDGRSP